MKKLVLIPLISFLVACQSTDTSSLGVAGNLPTHSFTNAKTVQEIRDLKPQVKPPINIAILPSNRWQGFSAGEVKLIEKWGEKLKATGFVKTFKMVPKSLTPSCGYKSDDDCFINQSRIAGARLGADAILFLNESTYTESYANFSSILNLTIVGMWVVPAHHKYSYSRYEASLFDIDNGYLYATSEGLGEHKYIRPFMYAENSVSQNYARLEALNNLGEKLLKMAKENMAP